MYEHKILAIAMAGEDTAQASASLSGNGKAQQAEGSTAEVLKGMPLPTDETPKAQKSMNEILIIAELAVGVVIAATYSIAQSLK